MGRRSVRIASVIATTAAVLGGIVGPANATGNTTLKLADFTADTQAGNWAVLGSSSSSVIGSASDGSGTPYDDGTAVTYPCLTAQLQHPPSGTIPNCVLPSFAESGVAGGTSHPYYDASNAGALRLTTDDRSEVGAVFYSTSFPTSAGLDIAFDTYQWGYQDDLLAADGIGFALAATNPASPQVPTSPGPKGGDLGYSSDALGFNLTHLDNSGLGPTDTPGPHVGLPDGYLGFGLDVFGNYANPDYQGTGCSDSALGLTAQQTYPEQISVKGPGNGQNGYCLLSSTTEVTPGTTATNTGANHTASITVPAAWNGTQYLNTGVSTSLGLDKETAQNDLPSSRPQPVETEILINTSGASEGMTPADQGGHCSTLSVPAHSYGICTVPVTPTGITTSEANAVFITDALPNGSGILPNSWLDSNGVPKQLVFGWTASTGSNVDIHEVNTFAATTSNGPIPVFDLASTDSAGGHFTNNANPTFTLTSDLQNTGGAGPEADLVTLTDTFPSGIDLSNAILVSAQDAAGNAWSCSRALQVVTCTISPTPEPGHVFPSGTTFPPINIYNANVTTSTGSLESDSVISSDDGLPATASDIGTVTAGAPTTTTVTNNPATTGSTPVIGQPVTYTAHIAPNSGPTTVDGGTVNFSINGALIPGCVGIAVVTTSTSIATCPTAQTYATVGLQPAVTATYTGDATYDGSVGADQVTIQPAPTTTVVSPSPTPVLNTPITYTATVTPSPGTTVDTGTGSTVSFKSGTTAILGCQDLAISNVGGTSHATCTTAQTYSTAGTQATITATYNPSNLDLSYSQSIGSYTPNIAAANNPTVTHVDPSPIPSLNTPITYTATVAPTAGGTVDAGSASTVSFTVGGTSVVGCQNIPIVNSGGVSTATCSVTQTYTTPGIEPQVVATYNGDSTYTTSNGSYTPDIVLPTTTAVAPTSTPVLGTPVTFVATVAPSGGGTVDAGSGSTVSFTAGGTPITGCQNIAIVNSGGVSTATCPTAQTYAAPGIEPQIVATYNGDAAYSTSNGNTTPQIILPTTTAVTPTPTPELNVPIVYTATVTPNSGPSVVDTTAASSSSTVSFRSGGTGGVGGTPIAGCQNVPITIVSGHSVATCSQTYTSIGTKPEIDATYNGDSAFSTSVGDYVPTVSPDPTTTVVSPSPAPALNTPITYTATVTPSTGTIVDPGSGSTVSFTSGGTSGTGGTPIVACQNVPIVNAGGISTATCVTTQTYTSTGPGAEIDATYNGDANFITSEGVYSPTIPQDTTVTAVSPSSTPTLNSQITYTAMVSPSTGTTVDAGPGSTVSFSAAGSPIAGCQNIPIVNAGGVSTAACLTAQTYTTTGTQPQITAHYNGDTSYTASTGTYTPVISGSAPPSGVSVGLSATASPSSSLYGTPVTLAATGLPTPATGTITFTTGGVFLCSYTLGSATSCVSPNQPVGAYQVLATYSGDTTYPSASAPTLFVVNATTITLVAKATPSTSPVGTAVSLTATGLPATATGRITFTASDGSVLCSYVIGAATSCPTSSTLVAGTYPVLATYSGDANDASASAVTSFILTPARPGSSGPTIRGGKSYNDTSTGHLPTPTGSGPFTYTITSQPPSYEGYCSVSATGVVTFTRASGYSGTVDCGYSVSGPTGVTVESGVYSVVAEPMVGGTVAVTPKGVAITVSIPRAQGKGPLTYKLLTGPPAADGHYTFSKDGSITFDPAPDFTGPVSFTYEVRDAHGNMSKPATTTIHVGASGIVIPGAHTGEPWAGATYWIAVSSFAVAGAALALSRVRRGRA